MNINGLSSGLSPIQHSQPARQAQKVDFTIDDSDSTSAIDARKAQAAANREAVGSIQGVLSTEENRAISELFGKLRSSYTFSGSDNKPSIPPGIRVNLSA